MIGWLICRLFHRHPEQVVILVTCGECGEIGVGPEDVTLHVFHNEVTVHCPQCFSVFVTSAKDQGHELMKHVATTLY